MTVPEPGNGHKECSGGCAMPKEKPGRNAEFFSFSCVPPGGFRLLVLPFNGSEVFHIVKHK